jgi:TonB family protein
VPLQIKIMKKYFLMLLSCFLAVCSYAQILLEPVAEPEPDVDCHCMGDCYEEFVEEMPYLFDSSCVHQDYREAKTCGDQRLFGFIKNEIQYPALALLYGIEGKVYIRFGVNAKGKIDHKSIKILKGTNSVLDDEALRIAYLLAEKRWVPAKSKHYCPLADAKTTNAYFTFPFVFKKPN